MKVTIAQISTINGDYEHNGAGILRAIDQGKQDKSDVVVLPETSIQGYTSLDWFLDRDVDQHSLEPLNRIIDETTGITAVVGTVRPTEKPSGRPLVFVLVTDEHPKLRNNPNITLCPRVNFKSTGELAAESSNLDGLTRA